jgi:glycosyltransferase involved in cell wall biosynthesis
MQIVAIIASYNEERFIEGCLEHLRAHGVKAYLCDNQSTDRTREIASRFLGSVVLGIEEFPRDGFYRWQRILQRKEELAASLDADWIMHLDVDEIPLPPRPGTTLLEAIAEADAAGFNVVEFSEFTFVPTREDPDHDHSDFRRTMRWYYHFAPRPRHLLRAWKRQSTPIDIKSTGGHIVEFPERRISPVHFRLLHYLFLSREHALRKYVGRNFDPDELAKGWHGWRPKVTPEMVRPPSQAELRYAGTDDDVDRSAPRTRHCIEWQNA